MDVRKKIFPTTEQPQEYLKLTPYTVQFVLKMIKQCAK